jgi:hypothetical protein
MRYIHLYSEHDTTNEMTEGSFIVCVITILIVNLYCM